MALINIRRQHSVGQGFFHSASLSENRSGRLRYIYDCGSATKYAEARKERIDDYLSNFKQDDRKVEIAFISHAHADHINGLPRLLDLGIGLRVDTIVLPYFNTIERLICFAHCSNMDPAATKDEFYRSFISNPIEALSNFKPRQIIQIRSAGGESPGAPDPDGEPSGPVPDIVGPREREIGVTWKLTGKGKIIQEDSHKIKTEASDTKVFTIEDSMGIAVPTHNSKVNCWLLSPFIDPAIETMQAIFKSALLRALNHGKPRSKKIKKTNFDKWLLESKNIEGLLTNNLTDLQEAYSNVEKNINFSSMCMYSGPPSNAIASSQNCDAVFGRWHTSIHGRIGWLATGDADLKTKSRRVAFFKHYSNLVNNVITFTIPHHGSENNFDPDLITRINPNFCVVAADTMGTWRHPGTQIVQSVASSGLFLSVVTASVNSEIREYATIE